MTAKSIAKGAALALLWALALAITLLPGCAAASTLVDGNPTVRPETRRLVAEVATVAYIRQAPTPGARAAKAARIRVVVAELQRTAAGEPITVQRLAMLALERIPGDLTPEERLLAIELVRQLQAEFLANIGHGGLESDSLVRLSDLLSAVDLAASVYAPAAGST